MDYDKYDIWKFMENMINRNIYKKFLLKTFNNST